MVCQRASTVLDLRHQAANYQLASASTMVAQINSSAVDAPVDADSDKRAN